MHGLLFVISAFRCAYCFFLNPARKTRPQAPRFSDVTGELKPPSDIQSTSSCAEDDDPSVSGDYDTVACLAPSLGRYLRIVMAILLTKYSLMLLYLEIKKGFYFLCLQTYNTVIFSSSFPLFLNPLLIVQNALKSEIKNYIYLLGKTALADVSAETDTQEPGTPITTEPSSASDGQTPPESEDLPPEKSDEEQDLSAMEVE